MANHFELKDECLLCELNCNIFNIFLTYCCILFFSSCFIYFRKKVTFFHFLILNVVFDFDNTKIRGFVSIKKLFEY